MAHHQIHHPTQHHHHHHPQRRHSSHHQHHHHHGAHLPEDHDDHSASEGSSIHHHIHENCNHPHSQAKSHHHHHYPHHQHQEKRYTEKNKSHSKASVTSSNSSRPSNSSTSSSSSSLDSSSSDSSSSSNTSYSSSSKSYISKSSFSSSSGSCSSWSSEASLEIVPFASQSKRGICHPQHSQSCMDIPRGRRAFEDDEDEEDSIPLLDTGGKLKKSTSMEKNEADKEKSVGTARKAKYSQQHYEKGNMRQQNQAKGAVVAANIRKSKSMEVLSRQTDNSGVEELDEKKLKIRKQEAHKTFVKEKIKFSTFLNEITRQVLSPSRLTSLGVTDVQRPTSPGQNSVKSPKPEHKREKPKNTQSRPESSASSITSATHSHISKHSHSSKNSHSSKHSHSRKHSHSSKNSHSNKLPYSEKDIDNQQQHKAVPRHRSNSARSDTLNSSSLKGFSFGTEHGHKGQKKHKIAHNEQHLHSSAHQHSHHTHSSSHHHYNEDNHSPPPCPHSPESENIHHYSHPESHHHRSPSSHHHHGTHHYPSPHHHSPHSDSHHHSPSPSHHHGAHHSPSSNHYSANSGTHHHPSHPESLQNPSHEESHHHNSSSSSHHHPGGTHISSPHHYSTHTETTPHPSHPQSHHVYLSPSALHLHGEHGSASHLSSPLESHHQQSHLKLPHPHSDFESSHPKSHQHYEFHHERPHHYHSHPDSHHNNPSHTDYHHHISEQKHHDFHNDSHSETHQQTHDTSPSSEHHHHSSHSDPQHHRHQHHHHKSNTYPKGLAHSKSSHNYENHHNSQSQSSQDHSPPHSKDHCHHHSSDSQSHHNRCFDHTESSHHHHSHSESQHHHDIEPQKSHHFLSEFKSDQHHLQKPQDSHHQSQSDSHHHSNPESNHSHHNEHSEFHHHSQPDSHSYNSQDHHYHHDYPESHSQYSHSESIHCHSHFKEDHHNDDHPSPLRHSPVGQRSTSPHSTKSDSSASSIVHDDQSTVSYQATSPFPKETDSELQRLIMLQEQNEVLNHSLLQTTVRMECMGAEFKTGHQLLESELQRTRIELNSLMDRFTRLQDNYSSTQQTNHHLEKKLHCVAQSMDEERERLNQRVSQLTEQLSAAKTTIQSLETINVTSMLQDALVKHLKSDDPITPLPVAPPPAQFMDSDHYDKRDDQSLGTLPEEEESDWSEMGEEVLMVSQGTHENTYFQWQQRQGCWEGANQYGRWNADTESESGGEENKTHQPPHGLQIPHLKFTVHPETLPVPIQDVSLARFKQSPDGPASESYQITDVRNLGSPIRVLSASLEEIHSIGLLKMQDDHGQLRSNKSMMDLHHTQIGTRQVSYVDDIVCNWRETNSQGSGEVVIGMVGLESAQKMLNHFIHDGESTHL